MALKNISMINFRVILHFRSKIRWFSWFLLETLFLIQDLSVGWIYFNDSFLLVRTGSLKFHRPQGEKKDIFPPGVLQDYSIESIHFKCIRFLLLRWVDCIWNEFRMIILCRIPKKTMDPIPCCFSAKGPTPTIPRCFSSFRQALPA